MFEKILNKIIDTEEYRFLLEHLSLFAKMQKDAIEQTEQIERILIQERLIAEQLIRITQLEEQVAMLMRTLYGKKSEKHKPEPKPELEPKSETIEVTSPEGTLPAFDSQENDEISVIGYTRKKSKKKKKNEQIDISKLPKVQQYHDLPDSEKQCVCCHNALTPAGNDISTQIEVIPSQFVVMEHITLKYSCRHCEKIVTHPKEPGAIPKSLAGNSFLTTVCINKFANHLPLYRQAKIFSTQGLKISDYSLGRWIIQVGDILRPVYDAGWQELILQPYLQVDETPVNCLENKKRAYMWVYVQFSEKFKPKLVLFDFQTTRGSIAVNDRLENFEGILQTDGYAGYNSLGKKETIVSIRCGSHIRRKFESVIKLSTGPHPVADQVLEYFKQLYDIEDEIKNNLNLTINERTNIRQEKSKPIMEIFHEFLQKNAKNTGAKSKLGQAIAYALNVWEEWSKYIDYGETEIDTNWVENQIRPFAVGRRNWLFIGNQEGGEAGAILYSLIVSATYHNLEPWAYIFYLLQHAHQMRKGSINPKDLLPYSVDPAAVNNMAKGHLKKIIELIQAGKSH